MKSKLMYNLTLIFFKCVIVVIANCGRGSQSKYIPAVQFSLKNPVSGFVVVLEPT